jgi:hypothetical protein
MRADGFADVADDRETFRERFVVHRVCRNDVRLGTDGDDPG